MTATKSPKAIRILLSHLTGSEQERVELAVTMAKQAHEGQRRHDGTPYVAHPIAVGAVLAEWGADCETIIGGLLHDVLEETPLKIGDIKEAFGRTVAFLVEGVTKFTDADIEGVKGLERKVETLRKLFEVMRRDIRVAIIKIADRLHNVRTIATLPKERQVRFAKETMSIFYHLAYHLGMNDVRRELSDRCMPVLHPEECREWHRIREQGMRKGKDIGKQMEEEIRAHSGKGMLISLYPHTRSFYSMLREKEERGGIRQGFVLIVIARNSDSCYELLKLFHSLYRPISTEFRDYIAAPTESAYQSLRTAVIGPEGEFVFLRIRTEEMDRIENRGVLLKCFDRKERDIPGFSWLQRSELLDRSTRESSEAFFEALKSDIFQEAVNVIVDGEEIHLPQKATVLDALYTRHGRKAHRAKDATVNGIAVSFGNPLADDAVVASEAAFESQVRHEWLSMAETTYARTLIVEALKERDRSEKVVLGRRLLQRELDHYRKGVVEDLSKTQLQEAADRFRRENPEELLVFIGEGVIQARDVLFYLFPEKERFSFLHRRVLSSYPFCLRIPGIRGRSRNILPQLHTLTRLSDVDITKTHIHGYQTRKTFDLFVRGVAQDRLRFADFVTLLERQTWAPQVRVLLSQRQWAVLVGAIVLAATAIIIDLLFLPRFTRATAGASSLIGAMLEVLPLLPILLVNYGILTLLRRHVIRLRVDRWFIGAGFLLNLAGLVLVTSPSLTAGIGATKLGLFPLIAVFAFSMLLIGYRFYQTEALFTQIDQRTLRPLSDEQWKQLVRRKIAGYAIRLCAVIIWGLLPLYIKYTPANEGALPSRVFFLGFGALLAAMIAAIGKRLLLPGRKIQWRIPWNIHLFNAMAGETGWMFFTGASLLLTTSTNWLLLQNFAPVLTLLIAAVLWRQTIPYLKDPKHIMWIFLTFLLGSTGSSLIIFNTIHTPGAGTILGDALGLVTMVFDTQLIIGVIRYLKLYPKAPGIPLNVHMFAPAVLLSLPFLLFLLISGTLPLSSLIAAPALYATGAGLILGGGVLVNFEAFRRIDGFIAFLMFNISILVTFAVEVFLLRKFEPTWALLIGGIIIVSSSIFAEVVNSHCQRKGL